jgi:hypothetical protein
MYIDPTQLVVLIVIILVLWQAFRYLSYRISKWITTAVVILIVLAIINPYQTRIMVHNLWYFLVDAFHKILYVVS